MSSQEQPSKEVMQQLYDKYGMSDECKGMIEATKGISKPKRPVSLEEIVSKIKSFCCKDLCDDCECNVHEAARAIAEINEGEK